MRSAAMKPNTTSIERAFELASSGRFSNVKEVRLKLAREGYNTDTMEGPLLYAQLREVIEKATVLKPSTPFKTKAQN